MPYYLLLGAAFALWLLGARLARDLGLFSSGARPASQNLALAALSISMALLLAEAGIHFFWVRTDYFGFSLPAARWWDLHWGPVNSRQFRDPEYGALAPDQRMVLLLGDSIVAGHGIERREDRVGNKLAARLGSGWEVRNAAVCGWNTAHEIGALKRELATSAPELVVLAYYPNDIESAIAARGLALPNIVSPPPQPLGAIVETSYLANLIYWRSYRWLKSDLLKSYWSRIEGLSREPETKEAHRRQLAELVDRSRAAGARFAAILFPNLFDLENERAISLEAAAAFRDLGVPVLDLHGVFEGHELSQLRVNPDDTHPNEKAHAIAADELFEFLVKNGLLGDPGA